MAEQLRRSRDYYCGTILLICVGKLTLQLIALRNIEGGLRNIEGGVLQGKSNGGGLLHWGVIREGDLLRPFRPGMLALAADDRPQLQMLLLLLLLQAVQDVWTMEVSRAVQMVWTVTMVRVVQMVRAVQMVRLR